MFVVCACCVTCIGIYYGVTYFDCVAYCDHVIHCNCLCGMGFVLVYAFCLFSVCLCDGCESIMDVTIFTTIVVGAIVIAILVYPIICWSLGRLCWHGALPYQVRSTATPIAT